MRPDFKKVFQIPVPIKVLMGFPCRAHILIICVFRTAHERARASESQFKVLGFQSQLQPGFSAGWSSEVHHLLFVHTSSLSSKHQEPSLPKKTLRVGGEFEAR